MAVNFSSKRFSDAPRSFMQFILSCVHTHILYLITDIVIKIRNATTTNNNNVLYDNKNITFHYLNTSDLIWAKTKNMLISEKSVKLND